jgi:hypothetical protein
MRNLSATESGDGTRLLILWKGGGAYTGDTITVGGQTIKLTGPLPMPGVYDRKTLRFEFAIPDDLHFSNCMRSHDLSMFAEWKDTQWPPPLAIYYNGEKRGVINGERIFLRFSERRHFDLHKSNPFFESHEFTSDARLILKTNSRGVLGVSGFPDSYSENVVVDMRKGELIDSKANRSFSNDGSLYGAVLALLFALIVVFKWRRLKKGATRGDVADGGR